MRYILMMFIVVLDGCTQIATYPPVETDFAVTFADSTKEPIPTIITTVLLYAHEHFGGMETIVFNLPVGIDADTYAIVEDRLGEARAMAFADQPAYHIIELRVRGFEADADVIFPSTPGQYEMATIHLESSIIAAWVVTHDRVWLVPVSNLPLPTLHQDDMDESSSAL